MATGKTTRAYTAPGKVVGFSFDLGAQRAVYGTQFDEYFADKDISIVKYRKPTESIGTPSFREESLADWRGDADIQIFELPQPVQLDTHVMSGCQDLWGRFMVLFGKAVEDESVRTLVIDTATLARRVKADAYLEELQQKALAGGAKPEQMRKQLIQIEWGHPNDTIRTIYQLLSGIGKNLIMIHHMKDERKDYPNSRGEMESRLTGTRIPDITTETDRYWDVGIQTVKDERSKAMSASYIKCGYNPGLEGGPVAGNSWNAMVAQIDGSLGGRLELETA